jgi:hypothetical protein
MFQSPFSRPKVVFQKEKSLYEKWKEFFVEKVNDGFIRFIPSDDIRQMPPEYMYPFGILSVLFLFGIFLAVFLPGYYTQTNTQYLTPSGAGQSSLCESVLISNTGVFLATKDGEWSGAKGFSFSLATYTASVNSYTITQNEYENLMWSVYEGISEVGAHAYNYTLATNLLIWMTHVWVDPEYSAQRFYFVGHATTVFHTEKTSGGLSSVAHDCINNNSVAAYDPANGNLLLNYNYESFISSPDCQDTLTPSYAGYTELANPSVFELTLDVRSLITATSVNIGILDLTDLQKILSSSYTFYHNGSVYNTSDYIDPAEPDMHPVSCIDHAGLSGARCVVVLGQIIGLPIFNHAGASMEYPEPCNCSVMHSINMTTVNQSSPEAQYYTNCNSFTFLSGLLFYNSRSADMILELAEKLPYSEILENSYYPMFMGSTFGVHSPDYDEYNTGGNREKAYEFCRSETYNMTCSFLTFSSFHVSYPSWSISPYYYQLPDGACKDTFTTSEENW